MPDALPQRLHKRWETPHLGSSAKACLRNKDQRARTTPEIQDGPMWMWRLNLQRVACFQQEGQVWHRMGTPADNSGGASTGRVWVLGDPRGVTATVSSSPPPVAPPAAQIWGKTFTTQPYRGTYQQAYQFLMSLSALLHMPCEIQSSASKGILPLKGCMLPACKRCSDLIKLDFLISVVKPVRCLWANTAERKHLNMHIAWYQHHP